MSRASPSPFEHPLFRRLGLDPPSPSPPPPLPPQPVVSSPIGLVQTPPAPPPRQSQNEMNHPRDLYLISPDESFTDDKIDELWEWYTINRERVDPTILFVRLVNSTRKPYQARLEASKNNNTNPVSGLESAAASVVEQWASTTAGCQTPSESGTTVRNGGAIDSAATDEVIAALGRVEGKIDGFSTEMRELAERAVEKQSLQRRSIEEKLDQNLEAVKGEISHQLRYLEDTVTGGQYDEATITREKVDELLDRMVRQLQVLEDRVTGVQSTEGDSIREKLDENLEITRSEFASQLRGLEDRAAGVHDVEASLIRTQLDEHLENIKGDNDTHDQDLTSSKTHKHAFRKSITADIFQCFSYFQPLPMAFC
ncbi:hypothetical protein DFH27DRAFT_191718 [Peziza echinospora]|nr:hypothetical protein DFH27DRAFT_191718 [Peziza echinospora]